MEVSNFVKKGSTRNRTEIAYDKIKDSICSGAIKPGEIEPDPCPGSASDTCQRRFGSDKKRHWCLCDRDFRERDEGFICRPETS